MASSSSNSWHKPAAAVFAVLLLVVFFFPRYEEKSPTQRPEKQRNESPAPVVTATPSAVPSNTPAPAPSPKPTPSSTPTPVASVAPSPEPAAAAAPAASSSPASPETSQPPADLEGSPGGTAADGENEGPDPELISKALAGVRFPPFPFATISFLRERRESIVKANEQASKEQGRPVKIKWPERMPSQLRALVLPGNYGTDVRFFAASETEDRVPRLDYVAEAVVQRTDGKRGVARWIVKIQFFSDEAAASLSYATAVEDLKAAGEGITITPYEAGDAAVQGDYPLGTLGQRERLYVVRQGQDLLEMQVIVGAPAQVQPKPILEVLKKLRSKPAKEEQ